MKRSLRLLVAKWLGPDCGEAIPENPVRPHALHAATKCTHRGIASSKRVSNLFLPAR